MQSVVKLFVQKCKPDFSLPWQRKRQLQTSGSGFPISNRRILTNAHVVCDQTSVRIRKHGDPKKYQAHVIHVGHECDIAVVGVDDDGFWEGLEPLEFGGVPECQDNVVVVGFPAGGDTLCVTCGVVSRVEVQNYCHSGRELLAIQIDAAINAGNSGGPALKDDKVIGIAFESLKKAENIGYIISIPVVERFLQDLERNGRYTGFCDLGVYEQDIESSHMRKYLKMGEDETGVLVRKVLKTSCGHGQILRGDVLMEINSVKIADDGSVHFRGKERIYWCHLVHMAFPGETITATVLRAGKKLSVDITAGIHSELVPRLFDVQPSYVVYSGLVFTTLSRPYLEHRYDDLWITKGPVRFSDIVFNQVQEKTDEGIVILSQVLASEVTTGYESGFSNMQLFRVNGISVLNLIHLCHLLDQFSKPHVVEEPDDKEAVSSSDAKGEETVEGVSSDESKEGVADFTALQNDQNDSFDDLVLLDCVNFLHFDLERNKAIVLEIEPALKKSGEMLKTYGISSPRSQDLPQQKY